jgi:hypothetical protein
MSGINFKVTGINEYKSGETWYKQVTLTEPEPPEGQQPVSLSFTVVSDRGGQFMRDADFTLAPTKATAGK